jgi:prefoldin subunit 5
MKSRLDTTEMEISFLNSQVQALKAEDKRLNRLIRNIKKGQPK